MKVLLIEDEPIWQIKIRMILEELCWEMVAIVSTIAEIPTALAAHKPDLILSDIVLNQTNVFSFFSKISTLTTPIVFISNFASEENYAQVKAMPAAVLIIKPFHTLTLKSTVDLLMNNQPSRQQTHGGGIWVRGKHNLKIWLREEQICWIQSSGNYLFIQTEPTKYAIKGSLNKVQPNFSPHFIQIHRAYLINAQFIQKVDLQRAVIQINDQLLPISRTCKEQVISFLQREL